MQTIVCPIWKQIQQVLLKMKMWVALFCTILYVNFSLEGSRVQICNGPSLSCVRCLLEVRPKCPYSVGKPLSESREFQALHNPRFESPISILFNLNLNFATTFLHHLAPWHTTLVNIYWITVWFGTVRQKIPWLGWVKVRLMFLVIYVDWVLLWGTPYD